MVVTNKNFIKNNPLIDTNMVIIVTSYEGHKPFLKYALSRYMETKKYVICAYDRHNDTVPNDIMNIPHSWVFKHKTYGAEKRNGWLWDIIYGASIIEFFNNIKYVAVVNGDCIWDKPEGIDDLISCLGNNDIMSCSSDDNLIHTCNMIWKSTAFLCFCDHVITKLNNNIPESYSPEVILRDWARKNLSVKHLSIQPRYPKGHFYEGKIDHYSSYNQPCTWSKIIGYRNLGGEHKVACQEHLEPVDGKYFDLRDEGSFLNRHEKDTLYMYYMTNDRRYLYQYWDTGEDSFFNRRYLSLEYYGKEKLINDSRRKELGPYSERGGWFDRFRCNSYIIKDDEYEKKWKKLIKEKGYD